MVHLRLLCGLPSAVLLAGFAAPAHAGFFDLFMQGQPQSRPEIQQPMEESAPRDFSPYETYAPRHSAPPRRHVVILHKNAQEKPETFKGKSADIMNDETLRDGDAVMTEKGLRIFAGSAASEHRAKDFASLEEIKGLTPTQQSALAEVDAPHKQDTAQLDTIQTQPPATGRSTVSETAHAWKWVRDPKGAMLRYVGP